MFCTNSGVDRYARNVGTETAVFSCAALFTSNPIGVLGGALFGLVKNISADAINRFGSVFRTYKEAIAFFVGLGLAIAALAGGGFPLAFADVVSLSLAGLGAGAVLYHLVSFTR